MFRILKRTLTAVALCLATANAANIVAVLEIIPSTDDANLNSFRIPPPNRRTPNQGERNPAV